MTDPRPEDLAELDKLARDVIDAAYRVGLAGAGEPPPVEPGPCTGTLPDSEATASRALAPSDANRMIRAYAATPLLFTVLGEEESAPFPNGALVQIMRWGAGEVTVAAAPGVTLYKSADRGNNIRSRYGVVQLWRQAAGVWVIYGDLSWLE